MKPAALALLLLFAACAARAAPRPIQPPAPEFPDSDLWVNAKGMTMKRLKGRRVALIAFINSANLNSLRALRLLKAWDERYALEGLSVVGVHSPLYGFQKDPAGVERQLRRLGVTFPVLLDDDRAVWKAYANEGWPALYLVDRRGKIVYDLLGEGGYAGFEDELRDALSDAGYRVPKERSAADPERTSCGAATQEIAFGAATPPKTTDLDAKDDDEETLTPGGELIVSSRDGELSHKGPWRKESDALRLTRKNEDHEAFLRVICRGTQVFGLLSGSGGGRKSRFFVRQDGLWLHSGDAGADVKFDDDGRSYVLADDPRLYWIVKNPDDSIHSLTIMPAESGSAILGFQFTDRCLPYVP